MGGWGLFANRGHAPGEMWRAGLVQGMVSALITLVLKRFLEGLSARLDGPAAYLLPPSISCATILALLWTLHTLAGTPEVWATLAVPFAVSSTYAWIYTAIVVRGRRAEAAR